MCNLQFPYDPGSFSNCVKKLLPGRPTSHGADLDVPPSLFQRAGKALKRRILGPVRWASLQASQRLKTVQSELARHHREEGHKSVLVYVVPYDVVRLRTGGGKRIAGIAKVLSADFRVYILSLTPPARPLSMHEVAHDVWMLAVPWSEKVDQSARDLVGTCEGAATLFSIAEHVEGCLELNAIVKQLSPVVRGWILPSPFAWPSIRRFFRPEAHILVYDVHDDLITFLRMGLSCSDPERLAQAERLEEDVLAGASAAAFCTIGDSESVLSRDSGVADKCVVVPNGVDTESCQWVPPARAAQIRNEVGLDRSLALFAGANYKPNHEAVNELVSHLAPRYPGVLFVVMGMHLAPYRAFGGAEPGENVVFTGPVEEPVKEAVFSLADIALAPMKSGTGSSLKIPDYLAHGKLVLGTPVGLRGFESFSKFNSVVAAEQVSDAMGEILAQLAVDPDVFTEAGSQAREEVRRTLDWAIAAEPLIRKLKAEQGNGKP